MNWRTLLDKFDEMFASFARPYQIYACSTSVALSLPLAIYLKAGDMTITALSATAGGIAGYTGYLRTADKKIAAGAATTTAQVVTPSGSATMTQGVQPDAVPATPPLTPTAPQLPHKMG